MNQESLFNEPLKVQIKNNNKILVDTSLESTQTKGTLSISEPISNLSAKITLPDGHFTASRFMQDKSNYICTIQAGNTDYSKTIIIVVTPLNDGTFQYRITVMNSMRGAA